MDPNLGLVALVIIFALAALKVSDPKMVDGLTKTILELFKHMK